MPVTADSLGSQKRASHFPGARATGNCESPLWVLGSELWYTVGSASLLKPQIVFPALLFTIYFK